jgi:hypothetical protein
LEGIDFPPENGMVPEGDVLFLKQDQKTQELLNWFHESMDKGNATHAISIRKKVRDQLKELQRQQKGDPRFQILIQQSMAAMDRCEDEMGEFIPIDSDGEN